MRGTYPEQITAIGMVTPVGFSWRESCAAMDAQLNRMRLHGNVRRAMIPGLPSGKTREFSMRELALHDLNTTPAFIHSASEINSEAGVAFAGMGTCIPHPNDPLYLLKGAVLAQTTNIQPQLVISAWAPEAPYDRHFVHAQTQREIVWGRRVPMVFPTHGMGDPGDATLAVLIAYACYRMLRSQTFTCIAILPPFIIGENS